MRRYFKFCVVGGSGVVVDVLLLYLLAGPRPSVFQLNLCKFAAAECAVVNNFAWNDLWTFAAVDGRRNGKHGRFARFVRFNLISLSGMVLAAALLNFQVYYLQTRVTPANIVSIAIVSVWNYGLSSKFGWKIGAPSPARDPAGP